MRGLGGPPSNASRSGSGSEIYERLPDSGSLGDDIDDPSFDDRLRLSGSDEGADSDEAYLDSMENNKRRNHQQVGGGGAGEHLVKPSQIKNKKKQQGKKMSSLATVQMLCLVINVNLSFLEPFKDNRRLSFFVIFHSILFLLNAAFSD
jgi:hypothetical protein